MSDRFFEELDEGGNAVASPVLYALGSLVGLVLLSIGVVGFFLSQFAIGQQSKQVIELLALLVGPIGAALLLYCLNWFRRA